MSDATRSIKLLIAGGSGLWAEKNHYTSIVAMKSEGIDVQLSVICDPINPHEIEPSERRESLQRILATDNPVWINPLGKTEAELSEELDKLHTKIKFDGIIISTNPAHHLFYCKWALKKKVNILCDKPLVTSKNSSFEPNQAQAIQNDYDYLLDLYSMNKSSNPAYLFCSPLRRRALTPYVVVAKGLADIQEKTGEGIRYMNVVINGGIHKYPAEYVKGGAHGHLDGVGTLSHSSYHYIDVIAWYLSAARGKIHSIDMDLPYILRIGEYLKTNSYHKLRELIEIEGRQFDDDIPVPDEVLKSELDFSFFLTLRDVEGNKVGLITYIVNYSTYSPRLVEYDPEVTEYAHHENGGRMSSAYFDIHQGAVQQWQVIKNDEAAKGHNIEVRHNLHPRLGESASKLSYQDAYENGTITSKDLFKSFVKACAGENISEEQRYLLSSFEQQRLTNRLYSLMYEKIAENFYNDNHKEDLAGTNSRIYLDEYIG